MAFGGLVFFGLTAFWGGDLFAQEAQTPAASEMSEGKAGQQADDENLLGGFDETSEPSGENDLLGGFDETSEPSEESNLLDGSDENVTDEPADAQQSGDSSFAWPVNGSVALNGVWNYAQKAPSTESHPDWRGLRRLEGVVKLRWDQKFLGSGRLVIDGRASYNSAPDGLDDGQVEKLPENFRTEYEKTQKQRLEEAEWREVFISFSPLDSLDIRFGRQIMPWGAGEVLSVVDVLNPRDMREPGMTEPDDARLPVTASRINFYAGSARLQLVAIHEIRFNKEPGYGSEFYFYADEDNFTARQNSFLFLEEQVPSHGGKNTEYGASLKLGFSGWDASFYAADYFEDSAHFAEAQAVPFLGTFPILRRYARLNLKGASFSATVGSWVIIGEVAKVAGYKYFGSAESFSQTKVLGGADYAGFMNTSLSFEVSLSRIDNFEDLPDNFTTQEVNEDTPAFAVNGQRSFLYETLKLSARGLWRGKNGDLSKIYRLAIDYDWTDNLALSGGAVVYDAGESAYSQQLDRNDRIFSSITYHF